ncbi:hypothetical protein BX600DRAFT_440680 [Xylariales sp. PMI_506]|nr:hypothetical protein BX600DRAFT_440680 [Xylariales sp. PMI_506]
MADEIAQLRKQLEKERRLREEEQQRREEAEEQAKASQRSREEAEERAKASQRSREEEQRLRIKAEERAKSSQQQTLTEYLDSCHLLSLAIDVVTDRSLTTQSEATNPDDFINRQEDIWDRLSASPEFSSDRLFPSKHQIEYVMSLVEPISSEIGLRAFERDTVENAVKKLVDATYNDELLRSSLDLQGTVTFESHTNLGANGGTGSDISTAMESMSLSQDGPSLRPRGGKARNKTRGKGNLADQFCIYRTSDGRSIPILAIEYKAPHKLSRNEVVTGLGSEIQLDRDIINQDGEGFEFTSKSLAAAVITQLFSYMIGKGIQYSYVNTGEAFVFLHIPDDPTKVYYSVCVPNLDVMDDEETRLHRTAVVQVFSFILQTLRVEPPPQAWHDAATFLDTWAVEYDDVLRNIPETDHSDPDDDDDATPPSPTPKRPGGSKKASASINEGRKTKGGKEKQVKIMDRLYCTHKCLLGLAYGGAIDKVCPNAADHGHEYPKRASFLQLIRSQLAQDRGATVDCAPLYLSGAVGSLFKVRLSSLGYTLVAKGMENENLSRLRHEEEMYNRLRSIQGKHVPVSVGMIHLELPFYCDGGVYAYFMFLSWAGRPLWEAFHYIGKDNAINAVTEAYSGIHKYQVVYGDAAMRNLLYDEHTKAVFVVDFERAEFCGRTPLGLVSLNRKRKRGKGRERGKRTGRGSEGKGNPA